MRTRISILIGLVAVLWLPLTAQASVPTLTNLTLAWSPVSNAATYTLAWGVQSGSYLFNQTCPSSVTNLTVTIANTTYYFVVCATDGSGNVSPNSSVVVYTPPVAPAPPAGLAVSGPAVGGPTSTASWNAVANVASYELYWGTNGPAYPPYPFSNSCTSTTGGLTGLLTNQVYNVAVSALGTNGLWSALSTPIVYTNGTAPPVAPGGLAVSGPAGGGSTATASWNSVANVASYELYWGTNGPSYPPYPSSNSCTSATGPLTGLLTNHVYNVAVSALGNNGLWSPLSTPFFYANALATTTTNVPLNPLPSPTGLSDIVFTSANGVPGIEVLWNTVNNAASYALYWSTNSGASSNASIWNTNCPVAHGTPANLIGGYIYYFWVTAIAGAGTAFTNSPPSAEFVYTNMLTTPANFTLSAVSNGVLAAWSPVIDAASNTLYLVPASGVYIPFAGCGSPLTNVLLTNLVANDVYTLAVAAIATNGNPGPYSTNVIFTNTIATGNPNTNPGPVIQPPLAVIVSAGSAPNSAFVTWGAATNATYYELTWGQATINNYAANLFNSTIVQQTNYTVPDLVTNQSYGFLVYALDSGFNQINFGDPAFYTNPAPPAPGIPQNFNVWGGPDPNSALASWSPVTSAGGYALCWGTSSGSVANYAFTNYCSNSISPEVTGLVTNQPYYFAVYALGTNGTQSGFSIEFIYTNVYVPPPPPATPQGLTVLAGGAANSATASWSPVPTAIGYDLCWGPSSGSTGNYALTNYCASPALTVPNLTTNQPYYFAVIALGSNNTQSGFSTEVVYTNVPPMAPAAPTGFTVVAGSADNSVYATWGSVSNATGYEFYWGTASHSYSSSNNLPVSQTSTTVPNLATNQGYYFAVAALGSNNTQSPFSSEVIYSNAGPSAPSAPPSTNRIAGIPPSLHMRLTNQAPIMAVLGTVGAQVQVQATTNLGDPLAWTTVDTVTLTNAAHFSSTNSTNALPPLLATAFVPAWQFYSLAAASNGAPLQFYRVAMPYDYPTLAYQVLPLTNYPTRLIGVYMTGLNDNVCYVTNQQNYIYCDATTYNIDVQSSGPTIRQIATSLAGVLDQTWNSAQELSYSNGVYQMLATVVATDPPSSDQVAGQQGPSSIQINF